MSKENNSKNIYQIPNTRFNLEPLDKPVDYIDYISGNPENVSNIEINVDPVVFDLDDEVKQPIPPRDDVIDFKHMEHFRRSIEKNISKESIEVLGMASDLEKSRSEFLASGQNLDAVKNGLRKTIFGGNSSRKATTIEQLRFAEAEIGSAMFGNNPDVRTEFFNDFDNTNSWFFYQQAINKKGDKSSVTLHYDVQPNGILRIKDKEINGCFIKGDELGNFLESATMYYEQVMVKVYKKQPYSDQRAA